MFTFTISVIIRSLLVLATSATWVLACPYSFILSLTVLFSHHCLLKHCYCICLYLETVFMKPRSAGVVKQGRSCSRSTKLPPLAGTVNAYYNPEYGQFCPWLPPHAFILHWSNRKHGLWFKLNVHSNAFSRPRRSESHTWVSAIFASRVVKRTTHARDRRKRVFHGYDDKA